MNKLNLALLNEVIGLAHQAPQYDKLPTMAQIAYIAHLYKAATLDWPQSYKFQIEEQAALMEDIINVLVAVEGFVL